ncbi:MAG: GTP 3',8-cyclase MoaA [Planctomycetaceae bacterium]
MNFNSDRRLVDRFGRVHTNLRVSVTDRCNLRCYYCMPAENVAFLPKPELLAYEEIERIVRIAASLGVTKVRLTGGEPLVRRDLSVLVENLAAITGLSLGLTTNGVLLAEAAQPLFDAGLRRINVSLDALDPVIFRKVTRRDGYEKVLEGIEAAKRVGFESIKINAVAVRGLTEDQLVPFGRFARESGCEVRFIEYMPLDADQAWERGKVLFADEILTALADGIRPLVPIGGDGHSPATEYVFDDGVGRIGIIASISRPFCESCNRFRLTSDGKARACLFSLEETDVRSLLRNDGSDDEIAEALIACVAGKWEGHEINTSRFLYPERAMYSIGG